MSLLILNHVAFISSATEKPLGDPTGVEYGEPVQIPVQITPMDQDAVYNVMGVELKQPHMILTDVEWKDSFKVGDKVTIRDEVYTVEKPVKTYLNLLPTDHIEVIVEKSQF